MQLFRIKDMEFEKYAFCKYILKLCRCPIRFSESSDDSVVWKMRFIFVRIYVVDDFIFVSLRELALHVKIAEWYNEN